MMIRARGFSFEMTLDQEATRLRALARHLEDATPTVLTAMGVQAVSWAVQDFRERSNGGNAAGVSWAPITLSGARTRLAGRAPYRNDSRELKSLHEQEKPLLEKLRRKMPSNKRLAGQKQVYGPKKTPGMIRGKLARNFMETEDGQKIVEIRKNRQKIKKRRAKQIEREKSNAKVGVDTGRLVNSLVYGVADLSSIKTPKGKDSEAPRENLKRAAFDISGNVIRVGSNMKYAGYFDERRPIFGPDFMSSDRKQKMDRLIEQAIDKYLEKKFNA
mgnify:FL=1